MLGINIDIKDKEYQEALKKALLRESFYHWEISSFEGPGQKISKKVLNICQEENKGLYKNRLVLTEEPIDKKGYCFKYMPLEKIIEKIIGTAYDYMLISSTIANLTKLRIYYFYSPSGGAGVSSRCLELAKDLQGESLVINLDYLHTYDNRTRARGLSDFLYYFIKLEGRRLAIEDFVYRFEGVDIMAGPRYAKDLDVLYSLNRQELIEYLKKHSHYDNVIFDLSSSQAIDYINDLKSFEYFILVRADKNKWNNFLTYIENQTEIGQKAIYTKKEEKIQVLIKKIGEISENS